jgi:hypothetical protein
VVTGVALESGTESRDGIGRLHTFDVSVKIDHANRFPSADRAIRSGLSPVVIRTAGALGFPELDRLSW